MAWNIPLAWAWEWAWACILIKYNVYVKYVFFLLFTGNLEWALDLWRQEGVQRRREDRKATLLKLKKYTLNPSILEL